jgi:hypothetical protein
MKRDAEMLGSVGEGMAMLLKGRVETVTGD